MKGRSSKTLHLGGNIHKEEMYVPFLISFRDYVSEAIMFQGLLITSLGSPREKTFAYRNLRNLLQSGCIVTEVVYMILFALYLFLFIVSCLDLESEWKERSQN